MENKWEKAKELDNGKFKRLIGVKRNTIEKMAKILSIDYAFKHENGGRNPKLSVENQLMLAIEYWRQYPTYEELGFTYGIAQSS